MCAWRPQGRHPVSLPAGAGRLGHLRLLLSAALPDSHPGEESNHRERPSPVPADAPKHNRHIPDGLDDGEARLLRLPLAAARFSLTAERLFHAAAPLASVSMLALACGWSDLLPRLPAWGQASALAALAVSIGGALVLARRRFRRPSPDEVAARLEAPLPHRPLTALRDQPALLPGSSAGSALSAQQQLWWQKHRQQMLAQLRAAPLPLPVFRLAAGGRLSRRGMTVVPLLALVLTLPAGLEDGKARLYRAVTLSWPTGSQSLAAGPTVNLWVTPPAYTHQPPRGRSVPELVPTARTGISPTDAGDGNTLLTVPEGSEFLLVGQGVANGAEIKVTLEVSPPQGGQTRTEERQGEQQQDGSWRLSWHPAPGRGSLEIRAGGHQLARWPVEITDDLPPVLHLAEALPEAASGRLRLKYQARDDYGLTGLEAVFLRDGVEHRLPLPPRMSPPRKADAAEAPRQETPATGASAAGTSAADRLHGLLQALPHRLAPSPEDRAGGSGSAGGADTLPMAEASLDPGSDPWAGLGVTLYLQATDAGGGVSRSEALEIVLPEHVFRNPQSIALAALRRHILQGLDEDGRQQGIQVLEDISRQPAGWHGDPAAFLMLRVAAIRLLLQRDLSATSAGSQEEAALLWSLALRLDEGSMATAGQQMDAASQALEQALQDKASPAEISRRIAELQQAISRYLQALAESAPDGVALDLPQDAPLLSPDQIGEMLQQMQGLGQLGATDSAQTLMEQLKSTLSALRSARPLDKDTLRALQQAQQEVKALTERQEQLLRQTFEQEQSLHTPAEVYGQLEDEQRQIGDTLSGPAFPLAAAPAGSPAARARDTARDAMQQAADALAAGQLRPARQMQEQALAALREGQKAMNQGGSGTLVLRPGGGATTSGSHDPLGRPTGLDDRSVKLPARPDVSRARDLLQELRERANTPDGRPPAEQDYLRRLLKPF